VRIRNSTADGQPLPVITVLFNKKLRIRNVAPYSFCKTITLVAMSSWF
jgi:hypothetical protein